MKTFDEIKNEIKLHRQHVNEHNALWENEGLTTSVRESGKTLDKELNQIYTDIGEHVSSLVENFNNIGVEIRSMTLETGYKEPYHSFYAKIDPSSYGGHHFVVKGFKYR